MSLKSDIMVLIGGDISNLIKAMNKAEKRADKSSKSMTSSFKSAGAAAAGIWTGGTVLKEGVAAFASLEDNLLIAAAAANLTEHEIDLLMQKTLKLGGEPAQTPMQVAAGFAEAARAGQSFDEMMKSIDANAQLTAASEFELGESVETTTDILSMFGQEAEDTQALVDILVAGANSASVTVTQMAESYKYAGSISDGLGQSIETTTAQMLVLAQAGIKSEAGGTALRGIWGQLLLKSDELSASYGVQVEKMEDGKVVTRELADIIDDLSEVNLTAKERFEIFGKIAGPGITALLKKGGSAIRKYESDLNNAAGSGKRVGEVMQSGIGGSLRTIGSDLQTASTMIGQQFAPALGLIAEHSYLVSRGVHVLTGTFNTMGSVASNAVAVALDQMSTLAKATDFIGVTDGLSEELRANAAIAAAAADNLANKANISFDKMLNGIEGVIEVEKKQITTLGESKVAVDTVAAAENTRAEKAVEGITRMTAAEKTAADERKENTIEMYKEIGVGAETYFQTEAQKILDQGAKWEELGASTVETQQYMYDKINTLSGEAWESGNQQVGQYLDGLTVGFTSATDSISADINQINTEEIEIAADIDTREFETDVNIVDSEKTRLNEETVVVSIEANTEGFDAAIQSVTGQISTSMGSIEELQNQINYLNDTPTMDPFRMDRDRYQKQIDTLRKTEGDPDEYKGRFSGKNLTGLFADGGIMTEQGPMNLQKYASGGIANSPQLALFGEGSKPEAYVPLPDGRSIPVTVTMKEQQSSGSNVTNNNTYNIHISQKMTNSEIEKLKQRLNINNRRTFNA